MLLWFVFGVFGIVSEVLKVFVFPSFGGLLWGGLFVFILGLEGLGVFVFLVFVFVFLCVVFGSVLFALFLFCCWIVFGVVFFALVFFFCFCFFCFFVLVFCFCFCFFFGGFKGQVRWPKGPPHLALALSSDEENNGHRRPILRRTF